MATAMIRYLLQRIENKIIRIRALIINQLTIYLLIQNELYNNFHKIIFHKKY